MWRVRVVQSEQHMICRLTASGGQGGPSKHGRNWQRKTAVSGSSPQLTLKKGAPGDQVWDLLCVQLASYLERGPLMWMMPLHLHVNQKSDYYILYYFSSPGKVLEVYTLLPVWTLVYTYQKTDVSCWTAWQSLRQVGPLRLGIEESNWSHFVTVSPWTPPCKPEYSPWFRTALWEGGRTLRSYIPSLSSRSWN